MSNFKCSECGMINIDCGKAGFKTPREIELETLVIELENRLKTLDEQAVTYQLTEKEYEEYKKLKVSSKQLEEENEATKAQRDTFANLMNVYKNISKGRQDSEIVIDYINKLKQKLKIAEEALTKISKLNLVMEHNGYTYRGFEDFLGKKEAQQALQKMKNVK